MKKLLLIALFALGITCVTFAQTDSTKVVTTDSLIIKIDNLAASQAVMEKQINKMSTNVSRSVNDNRKYGRVIDELVPVFVMAIIAGFFIVITLIITAAIYRKAQLKYNAMIKCVETTGTIPDYFSKREVQKASAVPIGGRVHLVLSLLSCIIGTIFMIVTIADNMSMMPRALCGLVGVAFIVACVYLFKYYNRSVGEQGRIEQ